jgi:hypothetical protein
MASTFPNSIDSFINPVYTKVNGLDYVKAEHVNDLQDAVRNIQIVVAGSGIGLGSSSNNYVPSNVSVKSAVEILDAALKVKQNSFESHLLSVMPTDPFQHHSNVIQVTSIGNMNSTRVQQALEEHQADIDAIMTGGYVEGSTLDDRYVTKSESASITGTLTVQQDLTALQNVFLGTSLSHEITASGSLNIGKNLSVLGTSDLLGDITVSNTSRIGTKDYFTYTNLTFDNAGIQLNSFKDIVINLNSDDGIDGVPSGSSFFIKNGVGSSLLTVSETGILSVPSKIISNSLELESELLIGSLNSAKLTKDNLEIQSSSFLIKLDSGSRFPSSELIVTEGGDLGTNNSSTSIILKVTESELIAGSKVQKKGISEKGYFGIKFYSDDAGGKFQGYGVNFKSKMLTTPSSITLSIDPTKSSNYNNVTVSDKSEYGFFVECDSLTVGEVILRGTYQTVGN